MCWEEFSFHPGRTVCTVHRCATPWLSCYIRKILGGSATARYFLEHEVSPWLPKRTARSAPPTFSPPSRKLPPAAAQKFQTAYHLMFDCEQLQTPLLATTTALIERGSCGMVWVAWTEFGSVGVGRRAVLGKSDKSSQGSGHPGLDPVSTTYSESSYSHASRVRGPFSL